MDAAAEMDVLFTPQPRCQAVGNILMQLLLIDSLIKTPMKMGHAADGNTFIKRINHVNINMARAAFKDKLLHLLEQ